MPLSIPQIEAMTLDQEERLARLESDQDSQAMWLVMVSERADIVRVVLSGAVAGLERLDENQAIIAARLEGALRIMADFRSFSRSQHAARRMLDEGAVRDVISTPALREPLL